MAPPRPRDRVHNRLAVCGFSLCVPMDILRRDVDLLLSRREVRSSYLICVACRYLGSGGLCLIDYAYICAGSKIGLSYGRRRVALFLSPRLPREAAT